MITFKLLPEVSLYFYKYNHDCTVDNIVEAEDLMSEDVRVEVLIKHIEYFHFALWNYCCTLSMMLDSRSNQFLALPVYFAALQVSKLTFWTQSRRINKLRYVIWRNKLTVSQFSYCDVKGKVGWVSSQHPHNTHVLYPTTSLSASLHSLSSVSSPPGCFSTMPISDEHSSSLICRLLGASLITHASSSFASSRHIGHDLLLFDLKKRPWMKPSAN